ncbi:excisionase family DNA-binding protein [Streptomyces sp. NBC_00239]|uniref:Excisionase family DNA-binding protein n=1 Tax=Streptomyces caledonius TaxID=3134107 RepID=A0ABU8U7K2_9ACTN|nr:excisionase family DNA-binding protein [Streptomyces sp. NBC_00239]
MKGANSADRLLTVDEAAGRLGTGVRFIRRLISERRIEYVKLGKHVRIADSVLTAYVAVRTVAPVRTRRVGYGTAA